MNIAEKLGRWFVVAVWIVAGAYSLLNVSIRFFTSQDAVYALSGLAFFVAAFGIARRNRWARPLSLVLWVVFGYWDFGAIGLFGDMRWFPLLGLALLFAALLWLMSPAAAGSQRGAMRHT